MTLDNFIPQIWSAQIEENLHKAHVYAQAPVVNTNHEGEIKKVGDSVRINAIGAITIGDYVKNVDLTPPQTLQDAGTVLTIEKAKFWYFDIDDVDAAQGNVDVMDSAMEEAAYGLADVIDQYVAGLFVASGTAAQIGTTAVPITIAATTDVYDYIVKMAVKLDEANVTPARRWIIVPPWAHGYLQRDIRFVQTTTGVGDAVRATGVIGEVAGLTVYKSNNVPLDVNGNFVIPASYQGAMSFAEQIDDVEGYRLQTRFADALRGLCLFGAKLIKPQAVASLTVTRPAGS